MKHLVGCAGLLDAAFVHDHHHAVGDFQRLFLVVRPQNGDELDPLMERSQHFTLCHGARRLKTKSQLGFRSPAAFAGNPDGAAFASCPDARWLTAVTDGTLLVVRFLTSIPPERLVSVVFNQWQENKPKALLRLRLKIGRKQLKALPFFSQNIS